MRVSIRGKFPRKYIIMVSQISNNLLIWRDLLHLLKNTFDQKVFTLTSALTLIITRTRNLTLTLTLTLTLKRNNVFGLTK